MSNELILLDQVGKKFHRTPWAGLLHALWKFGLRLLGRKPGERLGKDEFWALREISLIVKRGECLGVIGPNGAGKSTLLKLIHREFSPDAGRLLTLAPVKSLIRLGGGLQALLSGRENIYILCQQMGLDKDQTDALLEGIIHFAGLEEAIDAPVKTYSDGMYARLDFAIATSVQTDILLVDEVLAVGDIAFQIRALDRLNELKRKGTAIVFVSHSEMNVRHVADRCLLLFNGRQIALGEPDALFYQYYESIGFNRKRLPLGAVMPAPPPVSLGVAILGLRERAHTAEGGKVRTGGSLDWVLDYQASQAMADLELVLHFWSAAEVLVASMDSGLRRQQFTLAAGQGEIRIRLASMPLTAGFYRVAAGFNHGGHWLAYANPLLDLHVLQGETSRYSGLAVLDAVFD